MESLQDLESLKSSSHWEGLLHVIHFNVNIVYGLWEIEENKKTLKKKKSKAELTFQFNCNMIM